MPRKTKVSVSVHTQLLQEVERVAGKLSRSAIFEQALAGWLRQHRQAQLDRAIEDYYVSLQAAERAEDDAWAGVGDEAVRRSWDEPKQ
jgi:metal-responsive CopG/Arc/MetJ family transcriptional regulator